MRVPQHFLPCAVQVADRALLWLSSVYRVALAEPLKVVISDVGDTTFTQGWQDYRLDASDRSVDLVGLLRWLGGDDRLPLGPQAGERHPSDLVDSVRLAFPVGRQGDASLRRLLTFS